jgi:hypothetical protein
MSRVFTMRKCCPACRSWFTITSAASVFCQDRACKSRRRREDYAKRKAAHSPVAPVASGSDQHLARAITTGE